MFFFFLIGGVVLVLVGGQDVIFTTTKIVMIHQASKSIIMYTLICQTCYGHLNSFIILFTQPRSVQKGFTTNHQWVELMPDRLKIWTWQETSKDRTKYRTNHQFHSCPSCCDWNGNHLMGQGTSPPSPTHRSFPSCPDQTFERPHRWKARLFERAQKWSFNVRHIANGVPKTHVYKWCNIYI